MGGNMHVDDSCIGCGECAAECPMHLITMVDELPTVTNEQEPFCIGCQHCLAVCPTGGPCTLPGKTRQILFRLRRLRFCPTSIP
jgi:ferredoxin